MLRVFYGWAKTNKVRKIEAISVIFENRGQRDEKVDSFIKRMQNTVYIRIQTEDEMRDGKISNRMYTEYSIRMNDKNIRGSLKKALDINEQADKKMFPKPKETLSASIFMMPTYLSIQVTKNLSFNYLHI